MQELPLSLRWEERALGSGKGMGPELHPSLSLGPPVTSGVGEPAHSGCDPQ